MEKNFARNMIFEQIREVILNARRTAFKQVDTIKVITNFLIGKIIVDNEQSGYAKARYGSETLKNLSSKLTKEFGRGFSEDNLERFRNLYLIYKDKISVTDLNLLQHTAISATPSRKFLTQKSATPLRKSLEKSNLLKLTWSHFLLLMKMDEKERSFYEIESINNNWSVRELQRQYNSSLYERLALSKDKHKVYDLSKKGQIVEQPEDLIKQPYILEFLGLKEETSYTETELEKAIIDKIETFLLELGKGFLFEARQKRISFEGEDFFIDLVFYNRLLKCYVIIDLKIGKLTHQDIGQIQMYVNYFDRMVKLPDENHTIGIILCKQSNKAVVEFTLPEKEKRIFAREYKLYLPNKKELQKQLENI